MTELLTTELKSDLENMYKTSGDLLNLIETKSYENESREIKELMELIRFRLEDIEGTLQKDIFHCDYLVTKFKVLTEPS